MAKMSKRVKQTQREQVVARYEQRRRELKEQVRTGSQAEVAEAVRALARLPRDASPTRLRNRDVADGRPRAYLRKFGISRVRFREMAMRGELPGVTRSSW